MLYFARPALKFSMNVGHSINSQLKVGRGMVGGLMGCWMMIDSDVEIRIFPMLETHLMKLLLFEFVAFSPVFCQTFASVQYGCVCHRHLELELMKTCLSVQKEV